MGKADLHTHTRYTDGFSSPTQMVDKAVAVGLDILAVTDHGLIHPAQKAKQYAQNKNLPIEIIVGQEVASKQGEIVGLFLKQQIPTGLDIIETAKLIKNQGGISFIPHPHRLLIGFGLSFSNLEKLVKRSLIDGIEIINYWDPIKSARKKRNNKNDLWQLAALGNTDSHHWSTLGNVYTKFRGKTVNDLKMAIMSRQTKPVVINKNWADRLYDHLTHSWWEIQRKVGLKSKSKYPGKRGVAQRLAHMLELIQNG